MKALMIATTLMLAAAPSATWAQAPAAGDPHHPPQAATPAPAPAQPGSPPGHSGMGMMGGGMPMMNMMGDMPMMHMMHMHMMAMMRMMEMDQGMAAIDRIEGRIAFLRAELKITDAQASAWNAFADALRANAQKLGQARAAVTHQPAAGQHHAATMAERLDTQERWLQARLEGTRALKSALTSLYGTLSDEQKKTADELLAPHMGMGMRGMMGMMPGQMQQGGHEHGQMQPGQPGQMQPGQPGQMQPGAR